MKIVLFTSDSIRHKFLANTISNQFKNTLIISEHKEPTQNESNLMKNHFKMRENTEKIHFIGNESFLGYAIPIKYGKASSEEIFEIVKNFNPNVMIAFGSSIIKGPLMDLLPSGHFFNIHLGLSPYYRGTGTNFWPFVFDELECVGATIMHIDPGIDSGDIICHIVPNFEEHDNVHTIGCKTIQLCAKKIIELLLILEQGKQLNRVKQWEVENSRICKLDDFSDDSLIQYQKNLKKDMIKKYIANKKQIRLIKYP